MKKYQTKLRCGAAVLSALAALCLTACGGGGGSTAGAGNGQVTASGPLPPAPEPETIPAPSADPAPAAPLPAPSPAGGPVAAAVSQQAVPNGNYSVTSSDTTTVVLTLPRNEDLQAGDRVRVTGTGTAAWQLAQNALQFVDTTTLPGNSIPGVTWTAREPDPASPDLPWSGTAMSASGNRIAAIANPGGVYLSGDGGATWTRTPLPGTTWTQVQMSADGSRLAALGAGTLHVSSDFGATWAARTAAVAWTAVHMSDDGQRIAAVGGGSVFVSTDAGMTFTAVPGTANADWRAIAGSADGLRLVANASLYGGDPTRQGVYVSTDGGATWARRVGDGNWTHAASSADGQRLAALDNGGTPWVSDDGGATFTSRFSFSGWSGLAISRDGGTVAAQEPRNDTYGHRGYVFTSPGGNDPWAFRAGDLNLTWRGISLSSDGNRFAGADNGVAGTAGGKIYTSTGNRTSGGTLGSITGGQGQMVEVTYLGGGRFRVSGSGGGLFTIR